MKPSTQAKTNLISGIVLLIFAALFSITLLMQLLDFGTYQSGFFVTLGKMLYSVYGFSSILIPAFFLTAGLSCFATTWTARKAFRLLTAIVPFFTCVICEKIIPVLSVVVAAQCGDLKLGVDVEKPRFHDLGLAQTHGRFQRAQLAVYVAAADGVAVNEREPAHAASGQRLGAP